MIKKQGCGPCKMYEPRIKEVAKKGATGMLIIHETAPAAYGWNVVETSNTGPQLDLY